jgi:hypothetical protein
MQGRRGNPRVGDRDAAQALRKARQRVKENAIVIAMRVALHEQAAGKAKMIEQLDIGFDWRVRRGVAPARREGEFVCRTEDMRIRIPCLRWRFFARNPWTCYRAGYTRRLPHIHVIRSGWLNARARALAGL